MGDSSYEFTEGSGRRQRTYQRTVAGTAVEELTVNLTEATLPSYTITTPGLLTSTANTHLLQIMAGASNRVGIRRIVVSQSGLAGAASISRFQLLRLSTAGTGGTASGTPLPLDPADASPGATVRHALTSNKGTEGGTVWEEGISLLSAATQSTLKTVEWTFGADGITKVPWIAAGTANGLALKVTTAVGTAQVIVAVEFVEAGWA
ncbi:MAG: hypothetical protein KF809_17310 [Chloroflexi bacterium]|nr:hypothetical protein [Chloroflexota bacterium]